MAKIIIYEISPEEFGNLIRESLIEIIPQLLKSNDPVYLTRKQTADFLGVSLVTLHAWTKNGLLTKYRISNRIRYSKSEVEETLIKNNK